MKKILYIIEFSLAAILCCLYGCTEEIAPAEHDLEGCYGVYFPKQGNADSLTFSPSDRKEVRFTVKRMNKKGRINVPVTVSDPEVFQVGKIEFKDGEGETDFTVKFPNVRNGVTYKCSIMIEDPKYARIYSKYDTGVDFSVTVIQWDLLTGSTSSDRGRWRDAILSEFFVVEQPFLENRNIRIYERSDLPGYYRIEDAYSADYLAKMLYGPDAPASSIGGTYKSYIHVNATDPEKVWIAASEIGFNDRALGPVRIASFVPENAFDGVAEYGTLTDGVIEFPKQAVGVEIPNYAGKGQFLYANSSGKLRIVLPNAVVYEYGIEYKPGFSQNGVMPIEYAMGEHVAKAEYIIAEGRLSEEDAEKKALQIADKSVAEEVRTLETAASGTVSVEAPASGIYTIVSAHYDAAGNYVKYGFSDFFYAKTDSECELFVKPELIVSNKYVSEGHTEENSMEMFIYGKDIKSLSIALFQTKEYEYYKEKEGEDYWVDYIRKNVAPVPSEMLSYINDGGVLDLVTGLAPGTEYTFMALASNGYREELVTTTERTGGEYNILNEIFFGDLVPLTQDEIVGTEWDFYAVDQNKKLAKREKIGTAGISYYLGISADKEHVEIDGLYGPEAAKEFAHLGKDYHSEIGFKISDGFLYPGSTITGPVRYSAHNDYMRIYIATTFVTADGKGTTSSGLLKAGFTDDTKEVIAFVNNVSGDNLQQSGPCLGMGLRGYQTIYSDPIFGTVIPIEGLRYFSLYTDIMLVKKGTEAEPSGLSGTALMPGHVSVSGMPKNYYAGKTDGLLPKPLPNASGFKSQVNLK